MSDLIEYRSWWERNWKWFTLILGIASFLVFAIGSSPLGTKLFNGAKVYADPNLLENAILKAQENQQVTELFGFLEPVSGLNIMQGIVNYSNNDTTIDVYVRIKGSKGEGRMRIFADYNDGKWIYNTISILNKNLKEPIVVTTKAK